MRVFRWRVIEWGGGRVAVHDDAADGAVNMYRRFDHVVDCLMSCVGIPGVSGCFCVSVVLGLLLMAPSAIASFGVEPGSFGTAALERDGTVDTQAGSHPYDFTVNFVLNNNGKGPEGNLRDVEADLPKGLAGNPLAVARCSRAEFDTGFETACPGSTQIGVLNAVVSGIAIRAPVFNLVPPPGVLARIGVQVIGLSAIQDVSVGTGVGYGVIVDANNIPTQGIGSVSETIWGVPYDPGHDPERRCLIKGSEVTGCSLGDEFLPRPFLTLPTSCTGALSTTLKVDSTETPGVFPANALMETALSRDDGGNPVGLAGCERLAFEPSLTATPRTADGAPRTEDPSGLSVELRIPQPESPEGLNEANLREAVVSLPAGMSVSPSAANGLTGCPLLRGREEAKEARERKREEVGIDLETGQPANCPDSSKLGSVEIETPALEHVVRGSVFLAQQGNLAGNGSNPFGSLLALYVVAEGEGVTIKLPGEITVGENGQLTTRFGKDPITGEEALPQLPFSDLKMTFFSGSRAPLITPSTCGTYPTTAQLTPYGNDPGIGPLRPAVPSSSSFAISQDCTQGFEPSFASGTTNNQGAAYSPQVVAFSRRDGEQRLAGIQITEPPGLLATLKNAAQCPEPQASQGECGPDSQIGETTVAAGPGPEPYWVHGGRVYLTGPYKGAPFGLSVVVPAIAGPINLGTNGKPVVVRARIDVNPTTAQAIVTSDPLPTILQNIPLDARTVNVLVNRPNFMFNPTNCAPLAARATITSTSNIAKEVSSPFEAVNCAALPFKPSFKVSTQGKTSKANGASLIVNVAEKPGEANIHKVSLQLPLALPARLTTLQKACTAAQFEANPSGCPEASVIGTATATTPILSTPLTGPAYLVSHGGAAFPDVEFLLQGENGVHITLDGKTDIKKGITYSKFETVPDAPITSFQTTLPQGPHSALAANANLCKLTKTITKHKRVTIRVHGHTKHTTKTVKRTVPTPLLTPTTLTAQNGATLTQNTKITVTGCPKAKKAAKKATKRKISSNK
jgi:hypothetical protein